MGAMSAVWVSPPRLPRPVNAAGDGFLGVRDLQSVAGTRVPFPLSRRDPACLLTRAARSLPSPPPWTCWELDIHRPEWRSGDSDPVVATPGFGVF